MSGRRKKRRLSYEVLHDRHMLAASITATNYWEAGTDGYVAGQHFTPDTEVTVTLRLPGGEVEDKSEDVDANGEFLVEMDFDDDTPAGQAEGEVVSDDGIRIIFAVEVIAAGDGRPAETISVTSTTNINNDLDVDVDTGGNVQNDNTVGGDQTSGDVSIDITISNGNGSESGADSPPPDSEDTVEQTAGPYTLTVPELIEQDEPFDWSGSGYSGLRAENHDVVLYVLQAGQEWELGSDGPSSDGSVSGSDRMAEDIATGYAVLELRHEKTGAVLAQTIAYIGTSLPQPDPSLMQPLAEPATFVVVDAPAANHTVSFHDTENLKEGSDSLKVRLVGGIGHSQVIVQIKLDGDLIHDYGYQETDETGNYTGDLKLPHHLITDQRDGDTFDVVVTHNYEPTTERLFIKRGATFSVPNSNVRVGDDLRVVVVHGRGRSDVEVRLIGDNDSVIETWNRSRDNAMETDGSGYFDSANLAQGFEIPASAGTAQPNGRTVEVSHGGLTERFQITVHPALIVIETSEPASRVATSAPEVNPTPTVVQPPNSDGSVVVPRLVLNPTDGPVFAGLTEIVVSTPKYKDPDARNDWTDAFLSDWLIQYELPSDAVAYSIVARTEAAKRVLARSDVASSADFSCVDLVVGARARWGVDTKDEVIMGIVKAPLGLATPLYEIGDLDEFVKSGIQFSYFVKE